MAIEVADDVAGPVAVAVVGSVAVSERSVAGSLAVHCVASSIVCGGFGGKAMVGSLTTKLGLNLPILLAFTDKITFPSDLSIEESNPSFSLFIEL